MKIMNYFSILLFFIFAGDVSAESISDVFIHVTSFADLDAVLTPDCFGLLFISGDDEQVTEDLKDALQEAFDNLDLEDEIILFVITPQDPGYAEMTGILGINTPNIVALVGNCGVLSLDLDILEAEIEDIYYTWGAPDSRRSSGICRYCLRCGGIPRTCESR